MEREKNLRGQLSCLPGQSAAQATNLQLTHSQALFLLYSEWMPACDTSPVTQREPLKMSVRYASSHSQNWEP